MGLTFGHPSNAHRDIVPPTYDIELEGTFSWKLVLAYKNVPPDKVGHAFTWTRMSTFKPHIFSAALNKAALVYVRSVNNADVDSRDVFFEATSSTIDQGENAQEINSVLKKTQEGLGVEFMSTETDTRVYGGTSLSLYQRYFTAPGFYHDCGVYSTKPQEDRTVIISVKCQQVKFISGVIVSFAAEKPLGAIRHHPMEEDEAINDSINEGCSDKHAWLEPIYSLTKSCAASSFEVLRGRLGLPPPSASRLSEDAEDRLELRYIQPVVSDSPYKIYELALLRSPDGGELVLDPTWGYDGMTTDINFGRKGRPLYLAWKLRATSLWYLQLKEIPHV